MQEPVETWRQAIAACLDAAGSEVVGRLHAIELAARYQNLDSEGRQNFLILLAEEFGPSPEAIAAATRAWQEATEVGPRIDAQRQLRRALRPPYRRLFTQFHAVPDRAKFLVDLRADLLTIVSRSPQLQALDDALVFVLRSFFDFGFLKLERITWNSSAALLEKLVAYEAVHAIRSLEDLRNRLDSDRRCYALFHPSMPGEPLAFVEVALVAGLSSSIQKLLDEKAPVGDPHAADTAIFYSISSPQKGLRGISFGEYLLRGAARLLRQDLPQLGTFATLSPIPGFRVWLESRLARENAEFLDPDDPLRASLTTVLENRESLLEPETAAQLSPDLQKLCARYFHATRADGTPIDPVARFHLRNGARIEAIHANADISPKGLRQSLGLMVNYRYAAETLESNQATYETEQKIHAAAAVRALLD
ncbi:MAG: malonyl-CoA decarboxylase family protein [Candidatus Binatia bacterium]|nr:malonyl-CoA decarboxylase family protein [Candidatus Binatia bacterium]MDG2008806.1 malonyl-CoA decarboxylase family protein [Candidatus Binatia bacterium]